MTKPTFPALVHHFLRIALALLFVFAGTVKLLAIHAFAQDLGDLGLVHDALVLPSAWIISLSEVLAGMALAANVRGSLATVLVLLTGFIGVLIYAIALGLDVDCGCLGPDYHVTLKTQLVIDMGLVVWCGLIHWTRKRSGTRTMDLASMFLGLDDRKESNRGKLAR